MTFRCRKLQSVKSSEKNHGRLKYNKKLRGREAKNLIKFRIRLNIHMHIHNHLKIQQILCHITQIKVLTGEESRQRSLEGLKSRGKKRSSVK